VAWCPNCEYEYRSELTICPDCNEKLVSAKKTATSAVSPDDSWVKVIDFVNRAAAGRAKETLDKSNIPSVIMSAAFDNLHADRLRTEMLDAGADPCVILVPREFRDEAEIMIESTMGEDYISSDDETF
jgi:hypothetical protein